MLMPYNEAMYQLFILLRVKKCFLKTFNCSVGYGDIFLNLSHFGIFKLIMNKC